MHSIHATAHTQDTDKSITEDARATENEACYGEMISCPIEPEKLNMKN